MAVIVHVSDPPALYKAIRTAIADEKITTWSIDADGDFTYRPEQWRLKGWFRPKLTSDKIVFQILTPKKTPMTKVTYAIYHGRFIEMLLSHFDTQFDRAEATALPTQGDQVTG